MFGQTYLNQPRKSASLSASASHVGGGGGVGCQVQLKKTCAVTGVCGCSAPERVGCNKSFDSLLIGRARIRCNISFVQLLLLHCPLQTQTCHAWSFLGVATQTHADTNADSERSPFQLKLMEKNIFEAVVALQMCFFVRVVLISTFL